MDTPGRLDRSPRNWPPSVGHVVLAGAGITAIAAWLPWARLESATTAATTVGIDVDGFLTLLLAITVVGLVLIRGWGTLDRAGGLLSGVLVLALVWTFLRDPAFAGTLNDQLSGAGVSVTPAIGVYATILGGGLILVGSGWALVQSATDRDGPQG